jgi:hypothetical protein
MGGVKLVSARRCGARRRRRSKPEGVASWEGSERGQEGVEDRKETVKEIEDQRALYTRAKPARWRSGRAKPEGAANSDFWGKGGKGQNLTQSA